MMTGWNIEKKTSADYFQIILISKSDIIMTINADLFDDHTMLPSIAATIIGFIIFFL
jgi:hypothetical protein